MSASSLDADQIRAIEDGCEGVTPGPWEIGESGRTVAIGDDDDAYLCVVSRPTTRHALAAHIARLNPDTVRELVRGYRECAFWESERNRAALAEVEAREEAERLRDAIREHRETWVTGALEDANKTLWSVLDG